MKNTFNKQYTKIGKHQFAKLKKQQHRF